MEILIPQDEPSRFKTVGSRAKTNFGAKSLKINESQDSADFGLPSELDRGT